MARPRKPAGETPYQRRIRRYQETHPGASRQEARGHRLRPGERSEYARRVKGTKPGSRERREAAGKPTYGGEVQRFLRDLTDGAIVNVDADQARDSFDGRSFGVMTKWIIDGKPGSQGESYVFRGLTITRFRRLMEQEIRRGAIFVGAASLNQASLLAAVEGDLADARELELPAGPRRVA